MPLTAVGDEVAPVTDPAPAESQTPSPTPVNPLGPAPLTAGTGSSSADASALQPAGTNTLQSATTGSDGLTAPAQNQLQAPATGQDTINLLLSDADGPTYSLDEESEYNYWDLVWFALTLALLITFAAMVVRDRRRFRS
jgi:hypothetical protein